MFGKRAQNAFWTQESVVMCEPQHWVSLPWCHGGTLAHPPAGSSAGAASALLWYPHLHGESWICVLHIVALGSVGTWGHPGIFPAMALLFPAAGIFWKMVKFQLPSLACWWREWKVLGVGGTQSLRALLGLGGQGAVAVECCLTWQSGPGDLFFKDGSFFFCTSSSSGNGLYWKGP